MAAKQFQLGSVSHGTLRPEDLIPAFIDTFRALKKPVPRELWLSVRGCLTNAERWVETTDPDEQSELVCRLQDHLSLLGPPYTYFSCHPGDGSDFGFWPDWEQIEADIDAGELIKVEDLAELQRDFSGFAIVVNDHGNTSLYKVSRGNRVTEIWGVV